MIAGKHALVTGGGTGVGRAIALALAEAGVSVTICGRRKAKLEAVAGENARIFPIAADVTDEAAMTGLYAEAEELRGPFDIVVANAGGAESSPAHKTSLADWQRTLDLNLTGSFLTVKPALAGMAKRKAGRIVFVASTAGLKGYAYVAPYVAAKHGVVGLMRALATETVRSGVTVNARVPGLRRDRHAGGVGPAHRPHHRPHRRAGAGKPRHAPIRRAASSSRRRSRPPCCGCAARRRVDHRPGAVAVGRRDVVSGPLSASKEKLRLWIRLLRASRIIEGELRERLSKEFDTTLPRFDVMAALYRTPDGMLMSELSRLLLVSNGNITGIVDRLVSEGLVQRGQRNGDRRTSIVQLTGPARTLSHLAAAHERWVGELLAGVTKSDARQLTSMLKGFRSNWEGRE